MNRNDLLSFVLKGLKLLRIPYQITEHGVAVSIPSSFSPYFGVKKEQFLTVKDNVPGYERLSKDSFFIRELSFALSQHISPFFTIKSPAPSDFPFAEGFYFFYQFKLISHVIEETTFSFWFDPLADTSVPAGSPSSFPFPSSAVFLPFLPPDAYDLLLKKEPLIRKMAEKKAKGFFQSVQRKNARLLQQEVARIDTYFDAVKKEHEQHFTSQSFEDYGIMLKEKHNLIEQQKLKFAVSKDHFSITPLLVVFVKTEI